MDLFFFTPPPLLLSIPETLFSSAISEEGVSDSSSPSSSSSSALSRSESSLLAAAAETDISKIERRSMKKKDIKSQVDDAWLWSWTEEASYLPLKKLPVTKRERGES